MLRDSADCEADVRRFVERVAGSEVVWYLESDEGAGICESSDDDDEESENEPSVVMLFFSDEAYARRCQAAQYDDHEVQSMTLFDFLFRWLPGMSDDGVLAGPNWDQELIGVEIDALDLRERIEAALTPAQVAAHEENYQRLTEAEDAGS